MWSWRAGWDRCSRFEVRIVATVPSFSFTVELSNVAPAEAFYSMISSEVMGGLLVELNMETLRC